jgi:hypothetical protein
MVQIAGSPHLYASVVSPPIQGYMKIRSLTCLAVVLLAGCSVPFAGGGGEAKSACDQLAAQAIQTSSAANARDLAAQATECYARLAS